MFVLYSGITFVYAKYFWGDDEVPHIFLAMLFVWLLVMLLMSLIVMFGTIAGDNDELGDACLMHSIDSTFQQGSFAYFQQALGFCIG